MQGSPGQGSSRQEQPSLGRHGSIQPHCSRQAAVGTRAGSPSQLRFRPMNLPLKASFLINSISQAARARGQTSVYFTAEPEHIPRCFLRIEAGDGGEGRGRNLKMNLQPRAKQARPEEGRKAWCMLHTLTHARTQLSRWGLSAAILGETRGPGSLPNRLAGMGWRVALFMPGAGSWGCPGESGLFSGLIGFPSRQT